MTGAIYVVPITSWVWLSLGWCLIGMSGLVFARAIYNVLRGE